MIKHVFFDLDRTLWDFEKNSHNELSHLWRVHGLHQKGISLVEEFIRIYKRINEECWALYRENQITKEHLRVVRFRKTLNYFGLDEDGLADRIGLDYVANCPNRTELFPNVFEIIDYLKQSYQLHIITNGFEEVQHIKLRESKLAEHFDEVITSEKAGVKKPHPDIFEHAHNSVGVSAQECVVIGDDLKVDCIGAINYGMEAIYFNPHGVQHEVPVLADIKDLIEIKNFL